MSKRTRLWHGIFELVTGAGLIAYGIYYSAQEDWNRVLFAQLWLVLMELGSIRRELSRRSE